MELDEVEDDRPQQPREKRSQSISEDAEKDETGNIFDEAELGEAKKDFTPRLKLSKR